MRPFGHHSEVVTWEVPCSPCFRTNGCAGMECVRNVTVAQVFQLCLESLRRFPKAASAANTQASRIYRVMHGKRSFSMKFLYNNRLRSTLKSVYPNLYKLKQNVEWHRQYNGHFKRLVSFVEKLNRNYSNQLANLASSEETHPWTVDDELRGIAKNLKPELYRANPNAPTICTVALGNEYQNVVAPSLRTTQEYCARHQYNYLLLTECPPDLYRPYAWAKICLLFHALEHGYKNIMWLDADALITNVGVKLESFLTTLERTEKSMLITEI